MNAVYLKNNVVIMALIIENNSISLLLDIFTIIKMKIKVSKYGNTIKKWSNYLVYLLKVSVWKKKMARSRLIEMDGFLP